ncbi:MAG: hypothetical protein LBB88_03110 [Planctomycetaceae bacterium]|nr:hypothetical protein [Planctomycetaceae bacterium]
MNSYKLTNVETQCLASHCSIKSSPTETQCLASLLFDQKLTDRDAKHCVSTLGLVIQIRIEKTVNGYE